MTTRRRKLKVRAVEYLGGKCCNCGYSKCIDALEFHHKDPTKKDFGISKKGVPRKWEALVLELNKCILLCANCHREEHAKNKIIFCKKDKITKYDDYIDKIVSLRQNKKSYYDISKLLRISRNTVMKYYKLYIKNLQGKVAE